MVRAYRVEAGSRGRAGCSHSRRRGVEREPAPSRGFLSDPRQANTRANTNELSTSSVVDIADSNRQWHFVENLLSTYSKENQRLFPRRIPHSRASATLNCKHSTNQQGHFPCARVPSRRVLQVPEVSTQIVRRSRRLPGAGVSAPDIRYLAAFYKPGLPPYSFFPAPVRNSVQILSET